MSISFNPKSTATNGEIHLWMMVDIGGEFKAVRYQAKSVSELLSDGFLANASSRAREAFIKAGVKKSRIILAGQ